MDPHVVSYLQQSTIHEVRYFDNLTFHWILCRYRDVPVPIRRRIERRCIALAKLLHITKTLVFWLIPSSAKRRLPHGCDIITPKHINGGYTYPSTGDIYLFRAEELPKVVLHELLHHSRFDTSQQWSYNQLQQLYNHFGIDKKTNLQPNEAVIEAWAEFFQCVFVSLECGVPFEVLWAKEQAHATRLAQRLLQRKNMCHGEWLEETHSFSYVVLRSIFLQHWNDFVATNDTHELTSLLLRSTISPLPSPGTSLRMTVFGSI